MIVWQNERRKVADLVPLAGNPRKASPTEEQDLKASLERFNFVDPIIINLDGTIIGGHFRLRLLKQKGIGEVDVRIPDRQLTEVEVKELSLRLNKNTGSWDYDLLADFADIDLLTGVGFEELTLINPFSPQDVVEVEAGRFREGSALYELSCYVPTERKDIIIETLKKFKGLTHGERLDNLCKAVEANSDKH